MNFDVLIVGAGHGGAQAAIALRQAKFDGSIAIVGDEPELPYERPPLSKEYLAGDKSFDRILIRPATFWHDRNISIRSAERIVNVDATAHIATTSAGGNYHYGKLIWSTGGSPRLLACAGGTLAGVHAVRTRADVDRLATELATTSRVVVIGGGYIGLEAAAVLSKFGKKITVLEAQERVLARVAGEQLSRFFEQAHRAHGVDVRLSVEVDCILERDGRACAVRLVSGETIECEMVIVGIGIIPAVEPLLAAGAAGGNGVKVDEFCRTSLPDVYAIGDCALLQNAFADGAELRVESVQNANDQATCVARSIAGAPISYEAVPWFWSNQYDLRLQTVGLSLGYDETVVRGSLDARSFSIIYLKKGRVIALDCVNATKDYVQGRALVTGRASVATAQLADINIPLKSLGAYEA